MAAAVEPDIAIWSRSPRARGRYIEIAEQAARGCAFEAEQRVVLESCVLWLELFYISALTWEYIHQHEIRSLDQLRANATDVDRHVRSAFPDVDAVSQEIGSIAGDLAVPQELIHGDWSAIDWSQMVRSFDAIVTECPSEHLEAIGRKFAEPRLAHRARNAYDALRAFVRRHDHERAQIMRIVGEQYQRGNIRLRDAARLLGMSTSDAVFELEQDGFSRSAAAITLTEGERDAVYQRLRQHRFQRSTPPVVDPDLVERDVIASERIESVDARAWIRRR